MGKNSIYKTSTETSSSDIKVKHNLDREKEFTHCNNPLNRHLTTKGKIENELLFNKKPTMGCHEPILGEFIEGNLFLGQKFGLEINFVIDHRNK